MGRRPSPIEAGQLSRFAYHEILVQAFLTDTDPGYLARAMCRARDEWLGASRRREDYPEICRAIATFRRRCDSGSWDRLGRAIANAGFMAVIFNGIFYKASAVPPYGVRDVPDLYTNRVFRTALILDLDSSGMGR